MEEAVSVLEAALLADMAAFGDSLSRLLPGIATETFSHRHAHILHSLGLNCFPAGANALDERCVSLIVNVIDHAGLSVKGFVVWQEPSCHEEAETAGYEKLGLEELAEFCQRVRELFDPLRAAALRGGPPRKRGRSVVRPTPGPSKELSGEM